MLLMMMMMCALLTTNPHIGTRVPLASRYFEKSHLSVGTPVPFVSRYSSPFVSRLQSHLSVECSPICQSVLQSHLSVAPRVPFVPFVSRYISLSPIRQSIFQSNYMSVGTPVPYVSLYSCPICQSVLQPSVLIYGLMFHLS